MAPSIIGERATVLQMVMYAVLTVALTLIPFFQHEFGLSYFIAALLLNLVLLVRVARLFVKVQRNEAIDRPTALSLYKYSMSYLALLFLVMALERGP